MSRRIGQTQKQIFSRTKIEELLENYKNKASELVEIAKDAYWEVGAFIQDEAVARCPIDTGVAEKSLYIREGEGRGWYRVYITFDDSIPYQPPKYKDGRTTGDVWYFIHEMIQPEGPNGLGPLSERKQGSTDVTVGGGFLRRAVDENKKEIENLLTSIVAEKVAQMGLQKKKYKFVTKRGRTRRVGIDE